MCRGVRDVLGLLARGAVFRDGQDADELPIAAVETVSAAFMGMTVACAKCHDHMYDPIAQRDYYAMKALFDPLVVRKVILASPAEIIEAARAADEAGRLARYLAVEGKALHDLFCDWLWDVFTRIAVRDGEEAMHAIMRDSQATWMMRRTWRAMLKLPQKTLADRAGVHIETLSEFEREVHTPRVENIEKIARALESRGVVSLIPNCVMLDRKAAK